MYKEPTPIKPMPIWHKVILPVLVIVILSTVLAVILGNFIKEYQDHVLVQEQRINEVLKEDWKLHYYEQRAFRLEAEKELCTLKVIDCK